jgi:hypothetical protein
LLNSVGRRVGVELGIEVSRYQGRAGEGAGSDVVSALSSLVQTTRPWTESSKHARTLPLLAMRVAAYH